MAKKAKQTSSSPNVTRISASEPKQPKGTDAQPTEVKAKKTATATPKPKKVITERPNIFAAILGYFTGAWYELRQVHWPNRRATWGLTGGVILFTGGFVLIIVVLDAVFKYLFELVLG